MSDTTEQRYYQLIDRQNAGVTLQQLAAETGISTSMLSSLERGENGISVYRLSVICEFFGSGVGAILRAAGV